MQKTNITITIACLVVAVFFSLLGVHEALVGYPRLSMFYWSAGIAFATYACVGWVPLSVGRMRGDNETRCRKCRYILRGITEPRCPECGTPI